VARHDALDDFGREATHARDIRGRLLGVLGEPRVNVLEMNLELRRTGTS